MDEIFDESNCRAFITRKKCSTKNYTKNTYGNISDYIMFYSKTDNYVWNRPFDPWEYDKMIEQYPYVDEHGRRYKKVYMQCSLDLMDKCGFSILTSEDKIETVQEICNTYK